MKTTRVLHYVWRSEPVKLAVENAQCIDAVSLDVGDVTLYLNYEQLRTLWAIIGCHLATQTLAAKKEGRSCSSTV